VDSRECPPAGCVAVPALLASHRCVPLRRFLGGVGSNHPLLLLFLLLFLFSSSFSSSSSSVCFCFCFCFVLLLLFFFFFFFLLFFFFFCSVFFITLEPTVEFKDVYLKAKARIWPRLSYVCNIRSTAVLDAGIRAVCGSSSVWLEQCVVRAAAGPAALAGALGTSPMEA